MRTTSRRLAALLGAGLFAALSGSAGAVAAEPRAALDQNLHVVVGTVKRLEPSASGTDRAVRFRISYDEVLGEKSGKPGSVTVTASMSFSPADEPCKWTTIDFPKRRRYLVDITVRNGHDLLVDQCSDIRADTEVSRAKALRKLSRTDETPTAPPAPQVAVTPVADSHLPQFTRLASPGLAVVIVGLLGLFVVRRVDRR